MAKLLQGLTWGRAAIAGASRSPCPLGSALVQRSMQVTAHRRAACAWNSCGPCQLAPCCPMAACSCGSNLCSFCSASSASAITSCSTGSPTHAKSALANPYLSPSHLQSAYLAQGAHHSSHHSIRLLSRCCCQVAVVKVLLSRCCCQGAVVKVLLSRCCCQGAVVKVLVSRCCCQGAVNRMVVHKHTSDG